MERGDDGKFRKSSPPAASTPGEDSSGTGEIAYEEPVESLASGSVDAGVAFRCRGHERSSSRTKTRQRARQEALEKAGMALTTKRNQLHLCRVLSNNSNNN